MATTFPNGAVAIAPHLRDIEETWDGGFSRNEEADRKFLAAFPPSSDEVNLKNFRVGGHSVSYQGHYAVAFRVDTKANLIAFSGRRSNQITIDGKTFSFADQPMDAIAWAPVETERRKDAGVRIQINVAGQGTVHIPAKWLPPDLRLYSEGQAPGTRGKIVESAIVDGTLIFKATKENNGRSIY